MAKGTFPLSVALILGAALFGTGAQAHQSDPNVRPGSETEVIVDAPVQQVCRTVRRTGTRMRAARICRPVTQWQAARQGLSADDEMASAADRLDALGADDISTNCIGDPMGDADGDGIANARDHATPLGPRQGKER